MASTYSTNLKIELIGVGEQSGAWGTSTNTNLGTAIEQAIVGKGAAVFSTDADLTLSLSNTSAAQVARAFVLNVTSGVSLTATRNLVVPTIEKPYVVMNNTTGGQSIVVKTSAGSGITVPNGSQVFLYVDGTNVIQMLDAVGDLSYTGTLTGGTGVVNIGSGQLYKAADGKVGFGTDSPLAPVHVNNGNILLSNAYYLAARNAANTVSLNLIGRNSSDEVIIDADGYGVKMGAGGALNLTSAGNLGVGSAPGATSGKSIDLNGVNLQPLYILRASSLTSATAQWTLNTTNNTVDFVASDFGTRWIKGGTTHMTLDTSGNLTPGDDNTQTNGSAAKRWSVIYAGTGTINTSDAREKTPVRSFADDELAAAVALSKEIGVYQFLDSVKAKGDTARHHIGMTVQRAIEIMHSHGLDPFAYGFICYDKWGEETTEHPAVEAQEAVKAIDEVLDDEGNVIKPAADAQPAVEAKDAWTEVTLKAGDRYSFRYDQLTLFIARGIDARLAALEAK